MEYNETLFEWIIWKTYKKEGKIPLRCHLGLHWSIRGAIRVIYDWGGGYDWRCTKCGHIGNHNMDY